MNKKLEKLDNELKKLNSISEKLDFWETEVFPKYEHTSGYYDVANNHIPDIVFNELGTEETNTLLKIPVEIHEKHFENGYLDIEYCYWFLKFNAKFYCNHALIPMFEKRSNNPLKIDFIIAELMELKKVEEKATKHFLNKDFDIYTKRTNYAYENLVTLKRIQAEYYLSNRLDFVHGLGNKVTTVYANHIYFKSYLIDELKESDPKVYLNLFEKKQISTFESVLLRILRGISTKPVTFDKEDDIRSHFYFALNALSEDLYVTAESISRDGRTDLLIMGEYGRIIVEFKIWKRNNYKKIVNQTIGYLSDFENEGYIVVLNKEKNLIDKSYLKAISENGTGIVGEIEKIEYNKTGYNYYKSIHKINLRPKKITHFIYNQIQ